MADDGMYTGVDEPPKGIFGNEENKENQKKLDEEKRKLAELTPQLQEIVDMLDNEKVRMIDYIAEYVDKSKDSNELYRAELKAASMYRAYLDGLKTKFTLALNETRGKDD